MDFDFENRIVAPEFSSAEDNDIEMIKQALKQLAKNL